MEELVVLTLPYSLFSPFSQTAIYFIFIFIFIFSSCLDPQFTPRREDMESSRAEGKRSTRDNKMKEYAEMEEEEEEEEEDSGEDNKKKRGRKGGAGGGSAAAQPSCQVENCTTDMTGAKTYHRRHKVCELHAKAPVVVVAGIRQRFCQQCSRFHEISQFDEAKRSCRRRLLGHNERRRKSSYESHGEGSS